MHAVGNENRVFRVQWWVYPRRHHELFLENRGLCPVLLRVLIWRHFVQQFHCVARASNWSEEEEEEHACHLVGTLCVPVVEIFLFDLARKFEIFFFF